VPPSCCFNNANVCQVACSLDVARVPPPAAQPTTMVVVGSEPEPGIGIEEIEGEVSTIHRRLVDFMAHVKVLILKETGLEIGV
jgi:hypothetical protein